ncbi:GerMN domain-containing protein [Corynebacterium sp. TAE3-ERU12]|uniref:LpqB family beta-propeller domain-containing protein n=1 Tax=Corynebacterium sp. TAE3-ERU12 TaxID=2849491 RepID=UPI001C47C44B|nr:LpqB family beta-propeller domain-containing protein [Corynebacterium sp. TAE3-ERU12]MBV7294818.1 GerMN domain-containing protein [Corynebacterium sp. TAE3-ERU12]
MSAPTPRHFRRFLAAMTVAALTLSGCTSLPTNSDPQALRSFADRSRSMDIPVPRPDIAPDLVLRDFITAMAHPTDDHAAARAFLTPVANANWNPGRRTLVVEGVNVLASDDAGAGKAVYSASAKVLGQVRGGGAYEQSGGTWRGDIAMVRDPSGQWLIDGLPDGIVMERQSFTDTHIARNLYFVDPTGNYLVPDRRWIYKGTETDQAVLLDLLRRGPRPQMARGVSTSLQASASVEVTGVDEPVTQVSYANVGQLDDSQQLLLAAQTVWTLSKAGQRGPWSITVDGRALLGRQGQNWTRDSTEIKPYDPEQGPADRSNLRVLGDGALYTVTNKGVEIGEGPWGAGEPFLVSAAMGIDVTGDEIYAAVARTEGSQTKVAQLYVGRPGQQAESPLSGETLTRPSWSPGASGVWTVRDGDEVRRIAWSSASSGLVSEEVDISALDSFTGEISELRIDPTGTQAALLIDGKLVLATIVQTTKGPWQLVTPREISLPEGTAPLSLAWAPDSTILVGAWGTEAPIWRVQPDGSSNYMVPKVNLTAPVTVVAASSTRIFALDENALMELVSDEGDQQFWRPVPHVSGRAAPVTAE